MIRAIAFDAYGTLFDVYSIGKLAEDLFPGHGEALAALWRDKQIEYTRLRTLCDRYRDFRCVTEDALIFSARSLGLALDSATRSRLMAQYDRLALFPENHAALQALKALGLPLVILSNGTPGMLAAAVASAGLAGVFDQLLSVESVRRFKTAPEAYRLGPDALGVPAADILFVSSNGWDVCGATWYGFHTFWLNRRRLPPEELGVAPHAEGCSLDEVVDYVRAALNHSR
ncbi:haloacid dehalogenase type II [Plasticicumulans acidivorans]|uniref:(S)-2-haloacid dehalogenase n=1 Tax=Plasticicumulans acidivorans TaxID=886464 RepID=A0A317MU37_9GAMM|nr:haloacid dehalogenase type II [Plasticicumulans acidivorans]PWV60166.1 2-haloacid dehalogenase [Plasticicumulans acidivorans]